MSSDDEDYRTHTPSSNDSDNNSDTAFALALYARIHSSSPPSTPTDSPQQHHAVGGSPTPLLIPDADVRSARATDETGASDDCARLPSTFVTRVANRLRELCGGGDAYSNDENVNRTDTVTSLFASFLDRAEEQLADRYDQLVAASPSDESRDGLSPPPTGLLPVDSERAKALFHERYGTSLDTLMRTIDRVVQGLIDDYHTYHANENALLDAAERYDRLAQWVQQAKTLFGDNAATENAIRKEKDDTTTTHPDNPFDKLLYERLHTSPEWSNTFHDAQDTWQKLQTSRYALQQLEGLLGGRQGCRICFNQQVGVVLIPCGHVLCPSCADKVTSCPFCNTAFYSKQQMYFV